MYAIRSYYAALYIREFSSKLSLFLPRHFPWIIDNISSLIQVSSHDHLYLRSCEKSRLMFFLATTCSSSFIIAARNSKYNLYYSVTSIEEQTKSNPGRRQIKKAPRITSYNVCYTKLLRETTSRINVG